MKKFMQEEPALKFREYFPKVEDRRNKKNDSKIVFQIEERMIKK